MCYRVEHCINSTLVLCDLSECAVNIQTAKYILLKITYKNSFTKINLILKNVYTYSYVDKTSKVKEVLISQYRQSNVMSQ